jgi:hypothetical protein
MLTAMQIETLKGLLLLKLPACKPINHVTVQLQQQPQLQVQV